MHPSFVLLQFMCDKCDDIVSKNYRVDSVGRGQVACFSCAHRRGTKIAQESETDDLASSSNSGCAVKTHNILEEHGGLRDGSIASLNDANEDHPKWFDDEDKAAFPLEQRKTSKQKPPQFQPQRLAPSRNSECTYLVDLVTLPPKVFSHAPFSFFYCSSPKRDRLPSR